MPRMPDRFEPIEPEEEPFTPLTPDDEPFDAIDPDSDPDPIADAAGPTGYGPTPDQTREVPDA